MVDLPLPVAPTSATARVGGRVGGRMGGWVGWGASGWVGRRVECVLGQGGSGRRRGGGHLSPPAPPPTPPDAHSATRARALTRGAAWDVERHVLQHHRAIIVLQPGSSASGEWRVSMAMCGSRARKRGCGGWGGGAGDEPLGGGAKMRSQRRTTRASKQAGMQAQERKHACMQAGTRANKRTPGGGGVGGGGAR